MDHLVHVLPSTEGLMPGQLCRVVRYLPSKQYAELAGRYRNGTVKWRWVDHRGTLTKFEYQDARDIVDTELGLGVRSKLEIVNEDQTPHLVTGETV